MTRRTSEISDSWRANTDLGSAMRVRFFWIVPFSFFGVFARRQNHWRRPCIAGSTKKTTTPQRTFNAPFRSSFFLPVLFLCSSFSSFFVLPFPLFFGPWWEILILRTIWSEFPQTNKQGISKRRTKTVRNGSSRTFFSHKGTTTDQIFWIQLSKYEQKTSVERIWGWNLCVCTTCPRTTFWVSSISEVGSP